MYIDENGLAEFTAKMKTYIDNKFAPTPQEEYFLTLSAPNSFTLSVVDNTKYWDGTLETSTDKTTWTTWSGTSAVSSASDGTKHNIYVRGIGNTYITGSTASETTASWRLDGTNISISGNIENLLDYATVGRGNHPAMASSAYKWLFGYSQYRLGSTIRYINELILPAMTLTESCYEGMFIGLADVKTPPALPATALANSCYKDMFHATDLESVPVLPATTLADSCYNGMFRGCTHLHQMPKLPATTLKYRCYFNMFMASGNKISTTQDSEYVNAYRIPETGTGIEDGAQALNNMFKQTKGTFTGTPTINTTYYTSSEVA